MEFANKEKKRVYFLPEFQSELVKYFDENSDATLILSFDSFIGRKTNIDFSKLLEINYRKICIVGNHNNPDEFKSLLKSEILTELDNRDLTLEYDFKNFPNLEILILSWHKKCSNISECVKLLELSLWAYKPKSQDLTEFSSLKSLKELRIIQSNIKTISGIENLQNIREMIFIGNRSLSFEDVDVVFPNVEVLYIESCKGIRIEKVVAMFPNVKDLNFFSSVEIKSLRIILDNLKKLEILNVYDLKISETDNRYWKDYKNLKLLNFQDRKHQLLKRKDFPEYQNCR